MFCPSCGARCAPNAIACPACGTILPSLAELAPPGEPAHRGYAQAPAPAPAPAPAYRAPEPQQAWAPAPQYAPRPPEPQYAQRAPEPQYAQRAPEPQYAQRAPEPHNPFNNHGIPGGATAAVPSPFGAAPAHAGGSDDSVLVGRVKFIVEQGKILGEQFLLGDHDMSIGRYDAATGYCPDIDLTAQDPAYVHRQHARLTFSPDGRDLAITDLGGRNGCYVNNRLLERNGTARLRTGDKIRIGRVVMRLAGAGEADKPANQR